MPSCSDQPEGEPTKSLACGSLIEEILTSRLLTQSGDFEDSQQGNLHSNY